MGTRIAYQTKSRTLILDYLKQNGDRAVSVADIAAFLEANGNRVNVTTIYRYLDRLIMDGEVVKYISAGEKATFQLAAHTHSCSSHLHIQCDLCGRVDHLDCSFMDDISQHFLQHHGFELNCAGTILHGICRDCKEAKS